MANMIQTLENEQMQALAKTLPDFAPGDTVVVQVKVKEGERTRLQSFEGVVIAPLYRLNHACNITSRV